jgi:hypothetical protein
VYETRGRASNGTCKKRQNFHRAKSEDLVRCLAKTSKSATFLTEPNCALRDTEEQISEVTRSLLPAYDGLLGKLRAETPQQQH